MTRRYHSGRDPARAFSIGELRHMGMRRLPPFVREYLEGGAEEEVTLRRNRAVFDRIGFRPRALVDVSAPDISRDILGQNSHLPFVVGPTGFNGLFAHDGDMALARAAAAAGVPFAQSNISNASVEEVARVPNLRHWLQLYVFRSEAYMERLVARARDAGCEALVLTVDGSVFGNREWDRRNYRPGTTDPTWRNRLTLLAYPRWSLRMARHGIPSFGNLVEMLPEGSRGPAAATNWAREQIDAGLDWSRLDRLRRTWEGRLIVKGLLNAEDTLRAMEAGADAVVLSNHGGRQLDGAPSPLEVLPEVAERVAGRMPLFVDSGFRRGTDVVKALALGAEGVFLGRATLYGLAAAGEAGALRALRILEDETRRTLALLGCPRLAELDGRFVDWRNT